MGVLTRHQISVSYVQLFDNLAQHNFINCSVKLPNQMGVGISWVRLSVDDIPRYPELPGSRFDRMIDPELRSTGIAEGYFGDIEDAIFLSLGKSVGFHLELGGNFVPLTLPTQLSIGLNYKLISQKLDSATGNGQGIDVGLLISIYQEGTKSVMMRSQFNIGLNLQDSAGTTIAWNTSNHTREQLPINPLFGISYSQWIPALNVLMTIAMEQETIYGNTNHWGGEINFKDILCFRAGLCDNHMTAGTGLKFYGIRLDYAFLSYDLGNCHRISGSIDF